MKHLRRNKRKRYSCNDNNRNRRIQERILILYQDLPQINPPADGKDSRDSLKQLFVVLENRKQEKSVKEVQGINNLVI